jgi:hypothetical protein
MGALGVGCSQPPICDAGGPYTSVVGQDIDFDGTGSSDPDGTIVSYEWDFGNGDTGTGPNPVYAYPAVGTFTVTLTVTDNSENSVMCTTSADIELPPEPMGEIYLSASATERVHAMSVDLPFEPFTFYVVADVGTAWMGGWEASIEFEIPMVLIVLEVAFYPPGSVNLGDNENYRVGLADCVQTPFVLAEVTGMLIQLEYEFLISLHPAIPTSFPYSPAPGWADCSLNLRPFEASWATNTLILNPFPTGLAETATTPNAFALHPAVPNPFNPLTTIRFDLPEAVRVSLQIYNLSGQLVHSLVGASKLDAGRHEVTWNGQDQFGRGVSSGTYFYRLTAGDYVETRRMVLVR